MSRERGTDKPGFALNVFDDLFADEAHFALIDDLFRKQDLAQADRVGLAHFDVILIKL